MDEDRDTQRRYYLKYRDKIIARTKAWGAAHPEKVKEYKAKYRERSRPQLREASKIYNRGRPNQIHDTYLKRNYGISRADYDAMWEEQRGLCAICSNPEQRKSQRGRVNRLSVDHHHATGMVRALLCSRCNHLVGRCGENPELLRKVTAYIDKHSLHCNSHRQTA